MYLPIHLHGVKLVIRQPNLADNSIAVNLSYFHFFNQVFNKLSASKKKSKKK